MRGEERVERAKWLKPGAVLLVKGEITETGVVYALQLESLAAREHASGW
jgi:hypothetical protein